MNGEDGRSSGKKVVAGASRNRSREIMTSDRAATPPMQSCNLTFIIIVTINQYLARR